MRIIKVTLNLCNLPQTEHMVSGAVGKYNAPRIKKNERTYTM